MKDEEQELAAQNLSHKMEIRQQRARARKDIWSKEVKVLRHQKLFKSSFDPLPFTISNFSLYEVLKVFPGLSAFGGVE